MDKELLALGKVVPGNIACRPLRISIELIGDV
jgi:hypothetical protein